MTTADAHAAPPTTGPIACLKLLRVHQWAKSAFVFVGPTYWLAEHQPGSWPSFIVEVLLTAVAFALASSCCYVFNDLADIEADRAHPRKRRRPLASGAITPGTGRAVALVCAVLAAACAVAVPGPGRWVVTGLVALHVTNVLAYSAFLKHRVIADVLSLSMGFVIRVTAGCFAVAIAPSTWLLNVTFFLAMLLAFGKRLGERRVMEAEGADAADARGVQRAYSDILLQMFVVVSGVGTLLTYSGYISARDPGGYAYLFNFDPLWLTMIPATYGLLRAILLLERGRFDDPTELAVKDPLFQVSAFAFVAITAAVVFLLPA